MGEAPEQRRKPVRGLGLPLVIAFGLVACALYGVGAGFRSDIGILSQSLAEQCGLAYEDVSFCIALMQLVFGAAQPLFGIVAAKRSNRFVLVVGIALLSGSLVGMALARSFAALLLSLSVLFGCGTGALAFGLILSSAIRFVGPDRAMVISGMLNAAAGLGSFALSPALQGLLYFAGTTGALLCLLVPVAALVPIAFVVTSRDACSCDAYDNTTDGEGAGAGLVVASFKDVLNKRTFRLLVAGFTTCGFHMVIIESHLYNQFVLQGIDASLASWAYSVYGIATILGALLSGWLSTRLRKERLLAFYYGFRAVWVALYLLLLPKNLLCAVLFSIGLGLTGDATVSPTSGLVSDRFGAQSVATLVGVLFFCHQIGAFFSAWLGGVLLSATGSFASLWMVDIAACLFASLMSGRIGKRAL